MMNTQASSVEKFLDTIINEISFHLTDKTIPSNLRSMLSGTVLDGGKRFRPRLLITFGNFLGVAEDRLVPFARAVEFIHAATLAHDDVIDNSSERRSKKTINALGSNTHAILGGDYLLARVISELSMTGEIAIIRDVARVLEELVSGEWLQHEARGVAQVTSDHLETVAIKKTAALMGLCSTIPARLSRLSENVIELCAKFGTELGLAFQQRDDIFDFDHRSGKPIAKDFKEGLLNSVTCKLLELFPYRENQFVSSLGKSDPLPWSDDELKAALDETWTKVRSRAQKARAILDVILSETGIKENALTQQGLSGLLQIIDEVSNP